MDNYIKSLPKDEIIRERRVPFRRRGKYNKFCDSFTISENTHTKLCDMIQSGR